MCASVCGDGAVRITDRLPPPHCLPPVKRLLPHQSPKRRHRGVSASCLWVRPQLKQVVSSYPQCEMFICVFLYSVSHTAPVSHYKLIYFFLITCSKLRPSMMQHLLRRLVFDVPLLNEHTKMPLKVRSTSHLYVRS